MSTLIFCRSGQASAEKIIEKTGSSSPKMNGLQYNLAPASILLQIFGKHPPDRKRSKFAEAQIAFILQQAEEGTTVRRGLPQGTGSARRPFIRNTPA
jgi:hypothetical protein